MITQISRVSLTLKQCFEKEVYSVSHRAPSKVNYQLSYHLNNSKIFNVV